MAGYGYINNFRETELRDTPSSDHICRPVIIDSQGRKHPIIRYTNGIIPMVPAADTLVTKTETYVDHVHPPTIDPYKQQGQQLRRSTIHQNQYGPPQHVQEEVITSYQTEANNPAPYRRTSTGYRNYGNNDGDKQYQRDEYEQNLTQPTSDISTAMKRLINEAVAPAPAMKTNFKVGVPPVRREYVTTTTTDTNGIMPIPMVPDTLVTKTETYVIDPYKQQGHQNQYGPPQHVQEEFITSYQTKANPAPYLHTTGYSNYGNNDGDKQYQRDEYEKKLTQPTSDISTAMKLLINEAVAPAPAPAMKTNFKFGVLPPVRREYVTTTTTETISSSEAKRRYGNNASPFTGETENYYGTIDSKEAMRRYHGATV